VKNSTSSWEFFLTYRFDDGDDKNGSMTMLMRIRMIIIKVWMG
jgi:hypothetical protein